jgi:hypothetical protein
MATGGYRLYDNIAKEKDMTQSNIDATLNERGNRYGSFVGHAQITQQIKMSMMLGDKWVTLAHDQAEALDMIAHKIGRILNGDPDYIDSWHDIIGYARLVEQRLISEQESPRAREWTEADKWPHVE